MEGFLQQRLVASGGKPSEAWSDNLWVVLKRGQLVYEPFPPTADGQTRRPTKGKAAPEPVDKEPLDLGRVIQIVDHDPKGLSFLVTMATKQPHRRDPNDSGDEESGDESSSGSSSGSDDDRSSRPTEDESKHDAHPDGDAATATAAGPDDSDKGDENDTKADEEEEVDDDSDSSSESSLSSGAEEAQARAIEAIETASQAPSLNAPRKFPGLTNLGRPFNIEFSARTHKEKHSWLACLEVFDRVHYERAPPVVVSRETMRAAGVKPSLLARDRFDIPEREFRAVELCLEHLEEYGVGSRLVFRLPGSLTEVRFLLKKLLSGTAETIPADYEVAVVADTLKTLLRRMPETVLTSDLWPRFLKAGESRDYKMLAALVQLLPAKNREIMSRLSALCEEISQNSNLTKMDRSSLSLVVGPVLLPDDDPRHLLELRDYMPRLFDAIVSHVNYYFHPELVEASVAKTIKLALHDNVKSEEMLDAERNSVVDVPIALTDAVIEANRKWFVDENDEDGAGEDRATAAKRGGVAGFFRRVFSSGEEERKQTLREAAGLVDPDVQDHDKRGLFHHSALAVMAPVGLSVSKYAGQREDRAKAERAEPEYRPPDFRPYVNTVPHLAAAQPIQFSSDAALLDEHPPLPEDEVDIEAAMQAGGADNNAFRERVEPYTTTAAERVRTPAIVSPLLAGPALLAVAVGSRLGVVSRNYSAAAGPGACATRRSKAAAAKEAPRARPSASAPAIGDGAPEPTGEARPYAGPSVSQGNAHRLWQAIESVRARIRHMEGEESRLESVVARYRFAAEWEATHQTPLEADELDRLYTKRKVLTLDRGTDPLVDFSGTHAGAPSAKLYGRSGVAEEEMLAGDAGILLGGGGGGDGGESSASAADSADESRAPRAAGRLRGGAGGSRPRLERPLEAAPGDRVEMAEAAAAAGAESSSGSGSGSSYTGSDSGSSYTGDSAGFESASSGDEAAAAAKNQLGGGAGAVGREPASPWESEEEEDDDDEMASDRLGDGEAPRFVEASDDGVAAGGGSVDGPSAAAEELELLRRHRAMSQHRLRGTSGGAAAAAPVWSESESAESAESAGESGAEEPDVTGTIAAAPDDVDMPELARQAKRRRARMDQFLEGLEKVSQAERLRAEAEFERSLREAQIRSVRTLDESKRRHAFEAEALKSRSQATMLHSLAKRRDSVADSSAAPEAAEGPVFGARRDSDAYGDPLGVDAALGRDGGAEADQASDPGVSSGAGSMRGSVQPVDSSHEPSESGETSPASSSRSGSRSVRHSGPRSAGSGASSGGSLSAGARTASPDLGAATSQLLKDPSILEEYVAKRRLEREDRERRRMQAKMEARLAAEEEAARQKLRDEENMRRRHARDERLRQKELKRRERARQYMEYGLPHQREYEGYQAILRAHQNEINDLRVQLIRFLNDLDALMTADAGTWERDETYIPVSNERVPASN